MEERPPQLLGSVSVLDVRGQCQGQQDLPPSKPAVEPVGSHAFLSPSGSFGANHRITATCGNSTNILPFLEHIDEEIKKRRFDLKLTAFECRKILGVDKSTLSNWEQGKHRPSREHRARIIRF
jgi:DNA-binding transcriptional regulator YiaG